MSGIIQYGQSMSLLSDPVATFTQDLRSPTCRLIPYTLKVVAGLNWAVLVYSLIRIGWFDVRFCYLEFVRKDYVVAMMHMENYSLETFGVALHYPYIWIGRVVCWPMRRKRARHGRWLVKCGGEWS